jgi:phage major head subunit gpT-like protein
MSMTDDEGEPLNLIPNLLVVGPSNDRKARKLLVNEKNDAGADNEYAGSAEILLSARLTGA